MYHYAKSGKKKRQRRRLLAACFVLTGLWAAALWYLAGEQGLLPGSFSGQKPMATLLYHGACLEVPAGQTARAALGSLGLALTQEDIPSASPDMVLSPGAVFTVDTDTGRCTEVRQITV